MRAILFAAAVIFFSSVAFVQAQDNPACVKFENPLEYNDCLAKLGPRAGATFAVPEPGGATPATRAAPAPRGVRPMRAFRGAPRTRSRVRMEFTIRRR
jgi:hypothetical protein